MATKPKADTAKKSTAKKLKITLVRSVINTRESHRDVAATFAAADAALFSAKRDGRARVRDAQHIAI